MPTFTAPDGTELAYHLKGDGNPLVCVPGGPMLDSAYLQDLGGIDADRQLVLLDLRGTGDSGADRRRRRTAAIDRSPTSRRSGSTWASSGWTCSATRPAPTSSTGTSRRTPTGSARLVLVTPSPYGVGVDREDDERATLAASRSHEPWYPQAAAAFERVRDGSATEADWAAIDPFTYGRWDDEVRAYNDWMNSRQNAEAADVYREGFDPASSVPALARLDVPAVVLGGQLDLGNPPGLMEDVAAKIPGAEFVVQPGAGHFPWVDDPVAFRELLRPHLS